MRRSARLLITLVLALLPLFVLAACSDAPPSTTNSTPSLAAASTPAPPSATAPPEFTPEPTFDPESMEDFTKGPHFVIRTLSGTTQYTVNRIKMKANQRGQLTYHNDDPNVRHGFYIDRLIFIPMDPKLGITELTNATVNIQAPAAPGEYMFYCGVPGHREAGEHGVLEVVP